MFQLWHQRMAHLGPQNLARLESMAYGITLKGDPILPTCDACQRAKAKEHPHNHSIRPATRKFELLHTDILGPVNVDIRPSPPKYALLITDDFTRYCHIEILKSREDIVESLIKWITINDHDKHFARIRFDNEFNTKKFQDWCAEGGYKIEPTIPYTPEQNGLSERQNSTLMERVRSVMTSTQIPISAWPEIAQAVIWLKNRSPATGRDKLPYELWTGHKPDISHVRILGSKCYVKLPSEKVKKLQDRTVERIHVGYEGNSFYRVWDPVSKKAERAYSVEFEERPVYKRVSTEDANQQSKKPRHSVPVGETKERLLHIKGCKSDARGNLRTPDGKELRGPEGNKISLSNY